MPNNAFTTFLQRFYNVFIMLIFRAFAQNLSDLLQQHFRKISAWALRAALAAAFHRALGLGGKGVVEGGKGTLLGP